jgi:RNA polymerase sigma factor (TIGR02999 family)
MPEFKPGDVTQLLSLWGQGDRGALNRLMPLVYSELHRLAAAYLKQERRDHTLQPTGLIHEAYLRLVDQDHLQCRGRAQFFAIAANVMRQILVNHAKRRKAAKRGGGTRIAIEDAVALVGEPELDLLALDEALNKLAELDSRQCQIVEMRFFGGLTEEEIAKTVGVSSKTVKREWNTAKLMLYKELRGVGPTLA